MSRDDQARTPPAAERLFQPPGALVERTRAATRQPAPERHRLDRPASLAARARQALELARSRSGPSR